MTKSIDPVQATWYSSAVKVAYQNAAILRPHVRTESNVVGGTAEFPRITRGMARAHVPASDRVPMNVTYGKSVATMQAWSAAQWADSIEKTRVAFDEIPPLSEVIGGAIARRMDQVIVDAMVASFGTPTIADGGTGMTDAKLRQIARLFDTRAVPRGSRKLVVSAKVYDDIRSLAIAQNRDFGETAVGRTGVVPTIYGLDILMMDDAREEGGLPINTGVRQGFAFDSAAVGLAINTESSLEINWVPIRAAWLLEQRFSAGACVIDADGVIRVDCTE
jgi:hypothetical protein